MEKEAEELNKRIKAKEEIVRKLKLVKLHRVKVWIHLPATSFYDPYWVCKISFYILFSFQHDKVELDKVINQWLGVCQEALQDLLDKLRQQQSSDPADITMINLLQHMSIEPELVGYSVEDDSFIEPSPWKVTLKK